MKPFVALAVFAVVAIAGCGSTHDSSAPARTPASSTTSPTVVTTAAPRIAVVDKALVFTTSTGARQNARTIDLRTNAAQKWIQVSSACIGGGSLDVVVHVDGKTAPFNPSCNSPSDGTAVASMRIAPDSGFYGSVTVTVAPTVGQTWWIGAGITTKPPAAQ